MHRLNGTWATSNRFWKAQNLSDVDGLVLVTVQYRLGVFGWLASDRLRSRDGDNSTGNYGLQVAVHQPCALALYTSPVH